MKALLALLLSTSVAWAEVRVVDGDTVDVDGVRVRLLGIDTPEVFSWRCADELALGLKAKARLVELLRGKTVTYRGSRLDRWGRVLADVYADEVEVGAVLLKEGLALPWRPGPVAKAERLATWCKAKVDF